MPGLNGVWRGRSVLAQMAGQLGDGEQLDDHWRVLAELGERYSHPVLEWRAMLGGICQRLWKGQVDGAEDLLARAPSTVSAASDDLRRTHPALYGWCRWSAEDLDGLQELLAELDANVGGGGGDRTERGHPGLPALAGQQADLQLAVAELQGFPLDGDWVRALDRHPASPAVSPLLNRYVRGIALTAAGRAAEAEAAAEELRAMGATWVPGALADLVAAATTLAPDPEASLRSAHLARDAADRHGWALVRFRATMAMAHAAQRADLQQVGTDAARDSLDWAERHRLERSAARARRLLRGFGVQVASTGSEAHGGLTGRQWEVAGLVAAGLSNAEVADRLFISVRTVTTHLDHIFTRLDLTSRTALGAWYRDHQGDT